MPNMHKPTTLLIINAQPLPLASPRGPGGDLVSVRCSNGRIQAIAADLPVLASDQIIDANGGALLPGLHDHHIHLFATAAAHASIDCGELTAPALKQQIAERAARARSRGQYEVRVVNYHESIAGALDRELLDDWLADAPLRIQHSTGQMWFLNTAAITTLRIAELNDPGIERDNDGLPTGRLFRCDSLLRGQIDRYLRPAGAAAPSLAELSLELASYGVTGVTDTSPANSPEEWQLFHERQNSGELLQRLRVMGGLSLGVAPPYEASHSPALITTGELKIMLDEAALPDIDDLINQVASAHAARRGVAFHCVTHIELALIISVLNSTGCIGDRIEHASLLPRSTLNQLQDLGVRVVTQPGLVHSRGDRYNATLSERELEELYRLRTVLDHKIPLAAGSDAPYGPLNPWLAMQCATDRATKSNAKLGAAEAIDAEQALALYCCAASAPGDPESLKTTLMPGAAADLCVLTQPWPDARKRLADVTVAHTIRAGELIYSNPQRRIDQAVQTRR